jgi:small-conductance mechanosensitive channel
LSILLVLQAPAMSDWIKLVPPNNAVEPFGVRLVGFNTENGKKLLFTIVFVAVVLVIGRVARLINARVFDITRRHRAHFWTKQAIHVSVAVLLILGTVSIWFDEPSRLATAVGLVTAGLAFALQKYVSAVAGYLVILRGKTFNVGDRIVMGGVRGDVVALNFIQTTIMEMGQPPPVQADDPAMWVKSRQYTGRIVAVSNSKVFDEPVYNYTREFPYIWEEISIPIPYSADRSEAEAILLEVVRDRSALTTEMSAESLAELRRRYVMKDSSIEPRVYYRLTDNWLELSVRFVTEDHATRDVKDAIFRDVMDRFDAAGIGIASATYEIVGLPPLRIESAISASEASDKLRNGRQ